MIVRLLILFLLLAITSCAPRRPPVPVGVIPKREPLSAADERYGHAVLNQITKKYPISYEPRYINRVRPMIDRLVKGANADDNPWHVYVLEAPKVLNAGATRGNHIFVWSGLLDFVKNDLELSAVLAHEIAHVLSGHTAPNPEEEAQRMISGVAGMAARQIMIQQGIPGEFGQVVQSLVTETVKGFVLNPESQRKEMEADQISVFIMARSGIDPRAAVGLWRKVKDDSRFGGGGNGFEFFSTHPTSKKRLDALEELVKVAESDFQRARGGKKAPSNRSRKAPKPRQKSRSKAPVPKKKQTSAKKNSDNRRPTFKLDASSQPDKVMARQADPVGQAKGARSQIGVVHTSEVRAKIAPQEGATTLDVFNRGTEVRIVCQTGDWYRIASPVRSFVNKNAIEGAFNKTLSVSSCSS